MSHSIFLACWGKTVHDLLLRFENDCFHKKKCNSRKVSGIRKLNDKFYLNVRSFDVMQRYMNGISWQVVLCNNNKSLQNSYVSTADFLYYPTEHFENICWRAIFISIKLFDGLTLRLQNCKNDRSGNILLAIACGLNWRPGVQFIPELV